MASSYIRPGSRFYWVKWRSADRIEREPTTVEHGLPGARRRIEAVVAQCVLKEAMAPKKGASDRWEAWALDYLKERYEKTGSWPNVELAHRDLLVFFKTYKISSPRQVTYELAAKFIPWRTSTKEIPAVKKNTARMRFVYLSALMGEAVRRGYALFNPCKDIRVKREPSKEKQEITADDQKTIEEALKKAPDKMQKQWTIMMRQGCRIAETAVPLSRIDLDQNTITFRIKGGRLHTARIHNDLVPLVEEARARGEETLVAPSLRGDTSRWVEFFRKLKMPYSSHCCRVTVITRLLRGGINPALVSAFIGHSEEINRIYRRLKPPDAVHLLDILAAAPIL
jgi:hypothetical protein